MKELHRWTIAALTAVVLVGLIAAAASARVGSTAKAGASIKACALLPDTVSSTRYTLFDAPYLKAAFKAAGVSATVVNAHNDPQKQKSQAQQCLAQGAKVILLDQLDATSGAQLWTHQGVGPTSAIAIADGRVFAAWSSGFEEAFGLP